MTGMCWWQSGQDKHSFEAMLSERRS